MLPDVLLAQALGPGARAHQGLSIPGNLETCAIADGSGQASISVFHISGGFDADSVPAAPSSSGVDVEVTPAGGVGDSAMYLLIKLDDGPLLSLRVQRGSDVYAFNTQDSPGARDRLMALAQATLGQ
jgi:hypothetical protein